MRTFRRPVALIAASLMLGACTTAPPTPSTTPVATPRLQATPGPTVEATPTPSPPPPVEIPLAVVTGYTNPLASITRAEVDAAVEQDTIVQACEFFGAANPVPRCLPGAELVAHIEANPTDLALLPAGLVVPTVKVLPVDGADLFGGPAARAEPYPFSATMLENSGMESWPFEVEDVRTLMSLGDSCPDRGVAHAAITLGRGWEWVFGGGTAEYAAVYPNPVPEGFVGNGFNIVDAVATGNEGAVAELVSGADVTLDDFECPVVDDWTVNEGVVFSIDPAVLPHLRDAYGVDVATLAANHLFDRGTAGFLQTLDKFADAGIATAGAGADLDAALEPALLDVNGMTFGFVAFNEIPGSLEAGPQQPGVLWLRDENVIEAVSRARSGGADLVFCVPQWWGGAEYHAQFIGDMRRQQQVFFEAGCDHVIGHGTHWSGPIEIGELEDGRHAVTMVSHGNFLFGQEWSQQTQEGVILELAFVGTRLAQARMHPYVMLEQAQTNLTDPATDGLWVLNRFYEASGLPIVATP
ncbi:MAG: CapA family protein [Chloroflexota bacterium]|nr:CapA family protein [Chloroflexota bacterium]